MEQCKQVKLDIYFCWILLARIGFLYIKLHLFENGRLQMENYSQIEKSGVKLLK
jgi:hypothetical protein